MNTNDIDEKYMALALDLAENGRGKVEPNPMVGAVIVNRGVIVGKGYHMDFGGPHAEIHAITEGREKCKGATLYVSMEPCAHYGKTAPCVSSITKSGISRVVIAVIDPNPVTSGKGMQLLQAAGIEIKAGVLEDQAKRLNAPFFKLMQRGLPYIILKWAMSLDGKIATKTGDSKWISTEASRQYVHKIRSQVDAILVGINTVRKDDPFLTCRINGGRNPKRIIVDSNATLPLSSKLLKTKQESEIFVVTSFEAPRESVERLRQSGCNIIQTKSIQGRVDLRALLEQLGSMEMTNILVEGGSNVITSLIEERLADKIMVFIAPIITGGTGAPSPVLGEGINNIHEATKIEEVNVTRFSHDVLIEGVIKYNS